MAKKRQRDDDQAKKPDAPKSGAKAKPVVPNMSIDEPIDVEEVLEVEPIPVLEPAPAAEPLVLGDNDLDVEEVVEVAPADDELDVEEVLEEEVVEEMPVEVEEEPILMDDVVEVSGSSAVLAEPAKSDVARARPVTPPVKAVPAAPTSDVDLAALFEEESAAPAQAMPVAPSSAVELGGDVAVEPAAELPAEADVELVEMPAEAEADVELVEMPEEPAVAPVASAAPLDVDVELADEVAAEIDGAAPGSDVQALEEELVEESAAVPSASVPPPPASGVLDVDEIVDDSAEVPPLSDVVEKTPVPDAVAMEAVEEPASGVLDVEEVVDDSAEVPPLSDVAEAAPVSDAVAEEAAAEPASGVLDVEELVDDSAEVPPLSDVAESAEEVAEAAPASDLVADESAEEIIDAAPASDLVAEEPVEEVTDAAPASDTIAEEVAEEAVAAESSSATRRAEVVLDDEATIAESASAAEEADVVEASSSSVLADITVSTGSAAKKAPASKTVEIEKTIAFAPPGSATQKSDDDLLVTDEEEIAPAQEASAVDLGDMGEGKGSSVTGIDKVAEALESGVDLGSEDGERAVKVPPSVEFDELLDDMGDSDEGELVPAKAKKPAARDDDGSTDMEVAPFEEGLDTDEGPIVAKKKAGKKDKKKKSKSALKLTGDDIDLDDLLGEEPAEAVEAEETEEAVEAEAAEAFDEELEAAEAAEALDDEEVAEAEDTEEAEAAEAVEDEEIAEAEDTEEVEAAEAFDEEAEAAETFDEEAEAAEAFDEETEAAEAFDEDEEAEVAEAIDDDTEPVSGKKKKAGKKKRVLAGEETVAYDGEDVEEEIEARKKGSKYTTIAPPQPQKSMAVRWFGGMFIATLLLVGGAGAGFWFAADDIQELVKQSPSWTPPTRLENARKAMGEKRYAEVINNHLKDADKLDEFSVRGEARWLTYYKQQQDKVAPLDEADPTVKAALEDLDKGKNEVLAKQIKDQLQMAVKEKDLNEKLAKADKDKEKAEEDKTAAEKQLAGAKDAKDKAEKAVDAIAQALVAGKFIEDKTKFDAATLQKIMKELSDDKATLAKVNKALEGADIKTTGEEGLKEILKIKKGLEDNVAAVEKVLDTEKTKDKGAKGVLEIVDARNKVTKDRDDLFDTLKAAFKPLVDGKIVPENADPRKDIVAGTTLARQKAESPLTIPLSQLGISLGGIGSGTSKVVEQSFDMAKVFSELGFFKTREPFVQTPEQKLNTHITILQDRQRNNPKELAAITREADWILSPEAKANDETRGKATYVKGLVLRNEEKFAPAKATLAETLKLIQPLENTAPWTKLAIKSHKELTDPSAYYLPRMEKFQYDGNLKAALDEANTSLKAMPDEARLYAQRGLIRYEMIRGKGPKASAAVQKDIRADAATAAKDEKWVAEAAYLVGLLEEEIGNFSEAEKLYRQAIKMHQGPSDDAGKYRVALARLLLRDPSEAAPAPADDEKKKADKVGAMESPSSPQTSAASLRDETTLILHPWSLLIVSATIAQAPALDELEDKETLARLNETIKLAEELIASKNPKIQGQGRMLKGSALSKLGRRTEGLKEYTKGLTLLFPGIQTAEMAQLIEDHPAFQQPDSTVQRPLLAERHFGEGMHHYWLRQYTQAEAQFKQAVKWDDKDARYQYFLGLAQLHQQTKLKRDGAIFAFERGAQLEAAAIAADPYSARRINQSLERIQGELRQLLNRYRFKTDAAQ